MKRKSFVVVSLLLMAVGISFFAYSRHHAAESRNPLAMANVEALTRRESATVYSCFTSIVTVEKDDPLYNHTYFVHLCDDCKWHRVIDHSDEYSECAN